MTSQAASRGRTSGEPIRKVKFGDFTVEASPPSAALVEESVAASTRALDRLAKRLSKPGITLRPKKDVPLYSLAEDDPDVMIRKLNGRVERGKWVDGSFHPVD